MWAGSRRRRVDEDVLRARPDEARLKSRGRARRTRPKAQKGTTRSRVRKFRRQFGDVRGDTRSQVEFVEREGLLYYFKYGVEGSDDFLPVATSRPETILGDTAVCVNPADDRYSKFVGKRCVVPMSGGRSIPILADDYVDIEFGTGALKVTPGHDANDYAIGLRHDLPIINILDEAGALNSNGGAYAGLDRFDCRKKLWADMEDAGLARGGVVISPSRRDEARLRRFLRRWTAGAALVFERERERT